MTKTYFKRFTVMLMAVLMMVFSMSDIFADAYNFTPVTGSDDEGNLIKLELNSEAAYMVNMDTGEVVIDINSDEQRVPASLTKIMTAILLLDEFEGDESKLKSTTYSAGSEAFDELYGLGASTADIQPYEEVTCLDLLYALMLPSACEAANIIAIGMCGSLEDFIARMNEKASELEMTNTHFSCAHGLSTDDNYTTCADIAKMCTYAIDNYEVFKEVVSTYSYTLSATDYHPDGTDIYNTNLMLCTGSDYYYSYCLGIKTGTLDEAGRCFASYSICEGVRYLTVTMGAPLDKKDEDVTKGEENPDSVYAADTVYYNLIDHINLYEWAYDYIELVDLVDANSEIREAKVEYGEGGRDYVALKPESGCKIYLPSYISADDIERDVVVYENVVAPVYKGDVLGMLTLTYEGETIDEIPLVATESVNRSTVSAKTKVAKSYFGSDVFKIALALILAFFVVFVVIHIMRVQNRYKKK